MRTRFVYSTPHEAYLMATAQANYYRSCGLDLIGTRDALLNANGECLLAFLGNQGHVADRLGVDVLTSDDAPARYLQVSIRVD